MKSRWKENVIETMLVGTASTSILVVFLIFLFLGKEAFPFINDPGLAELWKKRWVPVSFQKEIFGVIPLITGSLVTTALAISFLVPFGVIGALFVAEFATSIEREILKPFIELLAAIPSVIIGFWGLIFLGPLIKNLFGLQSGLTALTGAFLLALMAIPTVLSISEDAIHSVPLSYKEASMALGASSLQTAWRVTLPAALPGIIAAIMLGIGRVIGETMVVLMVTGNAAAISFNPLESVRTMTATIAAEMGEVAFGSHHYQALFWVGIMLLIFTFGINMVAQRILRKSQI
ncbi:MAG: phosphate ABC transporter permease subunit PstC [Candidatus Marinimicrobia bacterium]|nr:phosphate ABC transporter permease subunit PstC [Candidatus Neomarinimicrobiota bacterium]